jgi:hypothetical protein
MTRSLSDLVRCTIRLATDSECRLQLSSNASATDGDEGSCTTIEGTIEGPFCSIARTLPTTFSIRAVAVAGQGVSETVVVDPCYWTPALPFLYRLNLTLRDARGDTFRISESLGLRRWCAEGADLKLERKRIVLRGAEMSANEATLPIAREVEIALLVGEPSVDFCRAASYQGVAIVADLRGASGDIETTLRNYALHASVLVVLVTDDAAKLLPTQALPLIARVVGAMDVQATIERYPRADILAVELDADERPPAWVAQCGKPAVAIRSTASFADFRGARETCDRLQADLAPQFNLAGYFFRLRQTDGMRQPASQPAWPSPWHEKL